MTTLGPGVRVSVGWAPDGDCTPLARPSRLQIGTIEDGPTRPGEPYPWPSEYPYNWTGENKWVVRLDSGGRIGAVESLLIPLDDGDPVETYKPEEVEA